MSSLFYFRYSQQIITPKKDGCTSAPVSISFPLSRNPGETVEMTVCRKEQTWWLSTAKRKMCVWKCQLLWKCKNHTGYIPIWYNYGLSLCPFKQGLHKTVQRDLLDRTDWHRDRRDMEMGGWDFAEHNNKVYKSLFMFKFIIMSCTAVL